MPSYDAILFDFDGVLADTEPIHYECWVEVLKPLGIQIDWPTFLKYCIGVPDRRAVQILCERSVPPVDFDSAWATEPRKQRLFRERTLANPPIQPETVALLRSLDGLKTAVVTASSRSEIEPLLERAGVRGCLDALICREDVERPKPAPDPYLAAAKQLGVKRPLVVEDSDTGAASGIAAGFDVLRVAGAADVPKEVRRRLSRSRAF
jgi:HAD superfamily hydrolase (TIGR01509 family)